MATLKDVIRDTGEIIAQHELWPELDSLWRAIRWQELPDEADMDGVALTPADEPVIRLFPNLPRNPRAGECVLREFGHFILRRGGDRAERIWENKLCIPEDAQITEFQNKLNDESLRKTCHSYEEVIQTYPTKGNSVTRLVAIHLSNALIANNIPYADSVGVDIRSWGPTVEFASLKKYYSLVPLTSAYCPKTLHEDFGVAFAELIVNNLNKVQDKSVAYALKAVIRNVLKRAED
jgi:hypothetical protein